MASKAEHIITHYVMGFPRSIVLGMGLSYAIEKENYLHVPLTILFPTAYAGYHAYKNRNDIMRWASGWPDIQSLNSPSQSPSL
jgi:hypothetical protein